MSNPPEQPSMRLAEILADLVSLRVCDPAAALSLVTTSKPKPAHTKPASSTDDHGTSELRDEEEDVDLRRAKELVELHYAVKEGHHRGELGRGLREAREGVQRAVGGV